MLALTSGAHRADTGVLATLVGADEVGEADPAFVREHTGQAIGGVAPIGHPGPFTQSWTRTWTGYDVVWAAAGHPKSVFPTTYAELLALTGGTAADVAQGRRIACRDRGSATRRTVRRPHADELRARLPEALDLYIPAMRYPAGTAEQRAPMWLAHMLRAAGATWSPWTGTTRWSAWPTATRACRASGGTSRCGGT